MRLLDRYLLRELLLPFGFCVVGFLVLWISLKLVTDLDDLHEKGLRTGDIAEYYVFKSPEFLVEVLPIALLLALLYTLSHHARFNEITAIRAAGVSLWRLAVPYLLVGSVTSAALFALNEFLAPASAEQAERIYHRRNAEKAAEENVFRNFGFNNARDGRTWKIAAYDLRTAEMLNPEVIWALPDGSQRWFYADRAMRSNDAWLFFNVREFRKEAASRDLIPALRTNMLAMPEFTETPDAIRCEIKIATRLARAKLRPADVPIVEILDYLHFHPVMAPTDHLWLFTKLHGRLAVPWRCLVVVLIALPFGAASGRRNIFVGVASSIFICFAFYVLQEISLALGTGGWMPAWLGGWLPNLAFGSAGLLMTARVR